MIKQGILLILQMLIEIYKAIPFDHQPTQEEIHYRAEIITKAQKFIVQHRFQLPEGDE